MTTTHPSEAIAMRIDGGHLLLRILTFNPIEERLIEATVSMTKQEVSSLIEKLGNMRDQLLED